MVMEGGQKGLDPERKINLGMVKKEDTFADAILFKVPQVVLYHYDVDTSTWERGSVEGAFFLYSRLQQPWCGAFILNRLSSTNYCQLLTTELEFLVKDRFLLFKEAGGAIHGVCFIDKATAKASGREVQSLLKDGKVTSSAPAHTQHRPPTGTEGKSLQSTQSTVKDGTKHHHHEKRKHCSVSATEVTDRTVHQHHSTGKTRAAKATARQGGVTPARQGGGTPARQGGVAPAGVEACAHSKQPAQKGMLSLEEVEKTLCTHPSGGTMDTTAPPTKTPPHTSHSQAAADILSMISPPRHHPLPAVATPPSPALPSPVIGTSEDFPENPPLMVSAGMKSGPVLYTPSKSPPLSDHHSNQTYSTGHHSDSELIGPRKQDRAGGRGSRDVNRDHVPTGDQPLVSNISRLMSPQAFVSPKPGLRPAGGRRRPEAEQPPTELCALSKQQMLDALKYLLVNDEGFVDKLHDAYRKSVTANQQ